MDETTPHMHFAFIPVVFDKKKNIEKVCAKEVITKTELKTFHKDYQEYLDNNLSYECLVHTGITKENKTIKELKDDTIRNYFISQKNAPILKDNQKTEDKPIQKVEVKKIPFLGEMIKKSDYDKLKSNFKKLNVKNSSLNEKIDVLKANNEKLTQDLAELKKSSKNIKISRLREELIDSSNKIEFLKSDLRQKDFTIKCFTDENKELKDSFKGAINEISNLNETLENFEKFIYYKTLDSSYNYYFFVENLNRLCDKSINSYLRKRIKSLNFKNLNLEQCKKILSEHEILKIRQVEITNYNKRDIQVIDDAVFEMTNNKSFETLDERINRYKEKIKSNKSITKKSRDFSL
ncbi:Uncharacterised protein [Chlamydia trachomatis]|nr:Uncharacterised protein [Chlamydia trachomatis]